MTKNKNNNKNKNVNKKKDKKNYKKNELTIKGKDNIKNKSNE